MASPELSCAYAALILNDDNIEITKEKIDSILNAAGVKVESYWVELFAEYFKNHNISELIKGTSLGGSQTNSNFESNPQESENDKNEEKKEEEEVELEGGFDDLFNS